MYYVTYSSLSCRAESGKRVEGGKSERGIDPGVGLGNMEQDDLERRCPAIWRAEDIVLIKRRSVVTTVINMPSRMRPAAEFRFKSFAVRRY